MHSENVVFQQYWYHKIHMLQVDMVFPSGTYLCHVIKIFISESDTLIKFLEFFVDYMTLNIL